LIRHAELAREVGVRPENIFVVDNGQVLDFTRRTGKIAGRVTSGKVLVDGLGVGDVGNIVLKDRKVLSQDGILIVVMAFNHDTGLLLAGPDIVSRGFVYVRESEELIEEAKIKVKDALEKCNCMGISDWSAIKSQVRDILGKFLFDKTRRRPMILPIIMEI